MVFLPLEQKVRIDGETVRLLNTAESSLYNLSGILSLFDTNEPIISILQLRESIESFKIDGLTLSLEDYFQSICLEEFEKIKPISNLHSASLLGEKLVKNVARSEHIIKSIYRELKGYKIENNSMSTEIYRSRPIENYNVSLPKDIPSQIKLLEDYIESDISYPPLINAANIHAAFEKIHPFETMNGVIGRILIHLLLFWKKGFVVSCLQISSSLNKNRPEYFSLLSEIDKKQNLDDWIKFFLSMIIDASEATSRITKELFRLKSAGYKKIITNNAATSTVLKFYDYIQTQPIISIPHITKNLSLTKQTANIVLSKIIELNLLEEVTGKQRYRIYSNKDMLEILK